MCILIHHNTNTSFNEDHLLDFYTKNSDGFGAIVNRGDKVDIIKHVGTFEDIKYLYDNEVHGYESVIHFRMRTHGDIDLDNCHPYQVTEDIWMAHNGVLSTGNSKDVKKSDTWHYINDFLRPMLESNPELLQNPAFQSLVADHIGPSNKFGFMDGKGRVTILNRKSGVEHFNAWLSNTYAWSPARWGYYARHGYQGGLWDDDFRYDYGSWAKKSTPLLTGAGSATTKKPSAPPVEAQRKRHLGNLSMEGLQKILRSSYNAMQRSDFAGLVDWVVANPMKAMHLIHEFFAGSFTDDQISEMVHSDPDEAAYWIENLWTDAAEDCHALAGIPFTKGEDDYAIHL